MPRVGHRSRASTGCLSRVRGGLAADAFGCGRGDRDDDHASSSANATVTGQLVTWTATVSSGSPGNVPVGSVSFAVDGGAATAPVSLNGAGQATFSLASLSPGMHTIGAAYTPTQGSEFDPSSATPPLNQTVSKAGTTTTMTIAPSPVAGQLTTLTMTVSPQAPGAGIPTGAVEIVADGQPLATAGLSTTSGKAAISIAAARATI